MATVTHTAMGYRATMEGDTLIVHDVPIFCACERGDLIIDDAWISKAVAMAKRGEREGYLPPLHTRHHDPATAVTNAVRAGGSFKVTRAGPITLNGQRRLAIFADLIITDAGTQHDVLAKRYPYRSVEITDGVDGEPKIMSLALLDHEAPFLQMPMLVVSGVDEKESDSVAPGFDDVLDQTFCAGALLDRRDLGSPVVACVRRGARANLLFREGNDMAEEEKKTVTETSGTVGTTGSQATLAFAADDSDDEKDDDKKTFEAEAMDISSIVKAIEAGTISVADMDMILVAIQNQKTAAPDEAPEEELAPAAAPGAESMKASTKDDAIKFGRQEGRIFALETAAAARDKADAVRVEVATAMERLKDRPLGADLEGRLVKFRQGCTPETFAAFVEEIDKNVGPLPSLTTSFHGDTADTPATAMRFQAQGVDAVDKAASFALQWDELKASGSGMRTPLDRYVERNMDKAGFKLATSA